MNYFYLVRHGQKVNAPGDPSLSELGLKQAEFTASYLKQFPIKQAYSSPLARAKETAEYIARKLNIPIFEEKDLRERLNWGDDPSLSFEEFIKLWKQTSSNRDFQPKVGDSSRSAGIRLEKVIDKISKQYPNTHTVLSYPCRSNR